MTQWETTLQQLRSFIFSAATTIQDDDLEGDDAWENLEWDLNKALEIVHNVTERRSAR